jgi:hypothetical protein
LQKIAAVVFSGDRFPPEEMEGRDRIMADLTAMMDHGCGLVCFHYATGLGASHVKPDGGRGLDRRAVPRAVDTDRAVGTRP